MQIYRLDGYFQNAVLDGDELELIVAAANIAGYMESAEKIVVDDDSSLVKFCLEAVSAFSESEDLVQGFPEFVAERLTEAFGVEQELELRLHNSLTNEACIGVRIVAQPDPKSSWVRTEEDYRNPDFPYCDVFGKNLETGVDGTIIYMVGEVCEIVGVDEQSNSVRLRNVSEGVLFEVPYSQYIADFGMDWTLDRTADIRSSLDSLLVEAENKNQQCISQDVKTQER